MSELIKKEDADESNSLQKIVQDISNIDSIISNSDLLKLQQLADPKLRMEIMSQIFYIKKMTESQTYGDALKEAVSKLAEYTKDLPFEKLIMSIETIAKVKASSDMDISKFMTEGKEADAELLKAHKTGESSDKPGGINVNIDNRSVVQNPVVQQVKDKLPPEVLDRILRVSESILNVAKGHKEPGKE